MRNKGPFQVEKCLNNPYFDWQLIEKPYFLKLATLLFERTSVKINVVPLYVVSPFSPAFRIFLLSLDISILIICLDVDPFVYSLEQIEFLDV